MKEDKELACKLKGAGLFNSFVSCRSGKEKKSKDYIDRFFNYEMHANLIGQKHSDFLDENFNQNKKVEQKQETILTILKNREKALLNKFIEHEKNNDSKNREIIESKFSDIVSHVNKLFESRTKKLNDKQISTRSIQSKDEIQLLIESELTEIENYVFQLCDANNDQLNFYKSFSLEIYLLKGHFDNVTSLSNYLYRPNFYYLYGNFSLGVTSLVDSFELASAAFNGINIDLSNYYSIHGKAKSYLSKPFYRQMSIGYIPMFSKKSMKWYHEKLRTKDYKPLVGFSKIKLNPLLFLNNGTSLIRELIKYIKSKLNNNKQIYKSAIEKIKEVQNEISGSNQLTEFILKIIEKSKDKILEAEDARDEIHNILFNLENQSEKKSKPIFDSIQQKINLKDFDFFITESLAWNELLITIHSKSYQKILESLYFLKDLKFKNLNIKKNIQHFDDFFDIIRKTSSDIKLVEGDFNVIETVETTLGFDFSIYEQLYDFFFNKKINFSTNVPEFINTNKEFFDKILNEIDEDDKIFADVAWSLKSGSRGKVINYFKNRLQDYEFTEVIAGRDDLIFPAKSYLSKKYKNGIPTRLFVLKNLIDKYILDDDITRVNTKVSIIHKLDNNIDSESVNHIKFYKHFYNLIRLQPKKIREFTNILSENCSNNQISSSLINLFSYIDNGLRDPLSFMNSYELRIYVEYLFDTLRLEKNSADKNKPISNKSVSTFNDRLSSILDSLERALNNRSKSDYYSADINDTNITYLGGVSALLSALTDGLLRPLSEKLGNPNSYMFINRRDEFSICNSALSISYRQSLKSEQLASVIVQELTNSQLDFLIFKEMQNGKNSIKEINLPKCFYLHPLLYKDNQLSKLITAAINGFLTKIGKTQAIEVYKPVYNNFSLYLDDTFFEHVYADINALFHSYFLDFDLFTFWYWCNTFTYCHYFEESDNGKFILNKEHFINRYLRFCFVAHYTNSSINLELLERKFGKEFITLVQEYDSVCKEYIADIISNTLINDVCNEMFKYCKNNFVSSFKMFNTSDETLITDSLALAIVDYRENFLADNVITYKYFTKKFIDDKTNRNESTQDNLFIHVCFLCYTIISLYYDESSYHCDQINVKRDTFKYLRNFIPSEENPNLHNEKANPEFLFKGEEKILLNEYGQKYSQESGSKIEGHSKIYLNPNGKTHIFYPITRSAVFKFRALFQMSLLDSSMVYKKSKIKYLMEEHLDK